MGRITLLLLLIIAGAAPAHAQKVTTTAGDSWIGVVSSVDASTRQIRLVARRGDKEETFDGVLDEDFGAQFLDNSVRRAQPSEIPVGTRVRAYYKTRREEAGGKKVKVNRVFAVALQGRDEFDRLRVRLGLDASAEVTPGKGAALPPSNPLRLHVHSDAPRTREEVLKWVEKWNAGEAGRHGAVEVVPDLARADLSLVVYDSATELTTPLEFPEGDVMVLPTATVFLVAPKAGGGLEVLWRYRPFFSPPHGPGPVRSIGKELEKRLKARSKAQGKS
jgi:hypothetical protein